MLKKTSSALRTRTHFPDMLYVTQKISIDEDEIHEDFIHASGPGGQNVNKVATGVQLRFDVKNSPSLSQELRHRVLRIAGEKATHGGVLVIHAKRFRSQRQNRRDAMERLIQLIRRASKRPAPRLKTRPPAKSKRRRLETKHRRSMVKRLRRPMVHGRDDRLNDS